MKTYTFHPLCELFAVTDEREFIEAMTASIMAAGQVRPIVLYKGQILDGRIRYLACVKLGIEPQFEEYNGDDPEGHWASLNFRRAHYITLDKAQIALKFMEMSKVKQDFPMLGKAEILSALGVSEYTVELVAYITKYAPDRLEKITAGLITIPQAVDNERGRAEVARLQEVKLRQRARREHKKRMARGLS